ncbi:hypothetical protein DES53_105326 [Roseimicrobium gellanilyticum]|uniref:Lipoprotein n=2 Tax=Roseimicrobium gellanilyticum TaxID=748857 RepID=A0A366HMX7_9BACT|nr:hypothetical protein DES53_105326 [Roseimicrobium gellanilyticum]
MPVKPFPFSVIAAACLCLMLAGCSRTPSGYDGMVKRHGGSHPDTIADPRVDAEHAVKWVQDWQKSLTFFTSELDSTDPAHVKTGIWSLGILAGAVELSAKADKAQFEKTFPREKLKQIHAAHPEYDEWYTGLRHSRFAAEFPSPKVTPAP